MATLDGLIDIPFLTENGDSFDSFFATTEFFDAAEATTLTREVVTDISTRLAALTTRDVVTDISIATQSGPLLVTWDVLAKLSAILPVYWVVINRGLSASLPVTWEVTSELASLAVLWNVIPDLQPAFSQDVQKPVADVTETP